MSISFEHIFTQQDNVLTIDYLNFKTVLKMPDYFKIDDVSDDLKALSLMLLYYNLDTTFVDYNFTRESSGNKIGLAFSGGLDCVAASALLPQEDTILFHHKRNSVMNSMYKHDNPEYVISNTKADVLVIESNLEDIRGLTGKRVGFMNDHSFFGGFVLLADYLNIGYLSTGMILEASYLKKGTIYRDFHNTEYWKFWGAYFNNAKLPLFFPCIPCSKVIIAKIVNANNLVAESCIRGVNGTKCNKCFKCYRSNLVNNVHADLKDNLDAHHYMLTKPMQHGLSIIRMMQKNNFYIEELDEYKNLDVSWLDDYFEYTLRSIPEEFRDYLRNELNKYAVCRLDSDVLKNFELPE